MAQRSPLSLPRAAEVAEIVISAAGYAVDNGKPTQKAACAASMIARGIDWASRRDMAQALGGQVTANQADLQAATSALLAIRQKFRTTPVTLHLGSKYVLGLLERRDGEFVVHPHVNEHMVNKLRIVAAQFPQLAILPDRSTDYQRALDAAKLTARTQQSTDTGTIQCSGDTCT